MRLSDVGWTDIKATTGVASVILTALGYEPDVKVLSVPVTYASLKNKDIDVFLGNWMPSMTADIKPYTDDKLGRDDLPRTSKAPAMASSCRNMSPTAASRRSTDIGKFKDKFDGKIYGIEAGNDGNRIILDMISKPENNLEGFELVESSEAGMLTQAEKSMKDNEWIAFLGWTPHPIMGEMKIAYLDGMGDSGFGAATVHTNVRAGYVTECPNVGKFISNLKFDLSMENQMMDAILKGGDANTRRHRLAEGQSGRGRRRGSTASPPSTAATRPPRSRPRSEAERLEPGLNEETAAFHRMAAVLHESAGGETMDPVSKWIASVKIPIGKWGKAFFDWLTTTFDAFFGAIADGLNFLLDGLVDLLLLVPPVILCLLIAALAWWLQRSRSLAIGVFDRPALHPQPGPVEADRRDAGAGGRGIGRLHGHRRADRHLGAPTSPRSTASCCPSST